MTAKRFALIVVVSVALASLLTTAVWASTRASAGTPGATMGDGYGSAMMGNGYGSAMMGNGYGSAMMGNGYGSAMMGNGYGSAMMGNGYGPAMMGNGYGPAMMGGYGLPGDGRRVDSLDAARQRAQVFADTLGLRVGEVMQFSNGFYAELNTVDGRGATEVLIDPRDGGVQLEFGPAMMWNTSYGMHRGGVSVSARVSVAEARALAQRWLDQQRPGLTAAEPEEFPGYVTLHTLRDGKITGMMSVNTSTGAVWYHSWHGQYLGMSEN